jgi:glycyl-tRNA synthetase
MFDIKEIITKSTFEEYYPHAIEPSFGVDRLLYSVFNHNFWTRKEDVNRVVLSLPYILTPYDVVIFPLHLKQNMIDVSNDIKKLLKLNGYTCYVDNSNVSIGKRYSRLDELSIKYAITIDPGYFKDNKVTIRDRNSTKQIRVDHDDILSSLNKIITNNDYFS